MVFDEGGQTACVISTGQAWNLPFTMKAAMTPNRPIIITPNGKKGFMDGLTSDRQTVRPVICGKVMHRINLVGKDERQ